VISQRGLKETFTASGNGAAGCLLLRGTAVRSEKGPGFNWVLIIEHSQKSGIMGVCPLHLSPDDSIELSISLSCLSR